MRGYHIAVGVQIRLARVAYRNRAYRCSYFRFSVRAINTDHLRIPLQHSNTRWPFRITILNGSWSFTVVAY